MLLDLARRLRALRRDLSTAANALVGRNPPPVVRVALRRPHAITSPAHPLRSMHVTRVVRETADAVTLVLEDARGEAVHFNAGQFFTLHVPLAGGEVARRAYSACSSPLDPTRVALTVKRVEGGRVSSHIVENLRAGQVLDVLGPSGSFTPAPATGPRRVVLVGGGSGITPLASIAHTLLATEPDTRVVLVYGNRARQDAIFADTLETLAGRHAATGRFVLRHVFEAPPEGWTGGVGRLDGAALLRELHMLALDDLEARRPPAEGPSEYFLCGPDPMMRAVRIALVGIAVPNERIHEERFVSAHASPSAIPTAAQTVMVRSRAGSRSLLVPRGSTVLEAAFDARLDMPFSCTVGGCGACRVRLVEGDVAMDEPNCLTPEERASGYVLACVSRPSGPCTLEIA